MVDDQEKNKMPEMLNGAGQSDKEAGKAYLQKIYLQSEACSKIADQADVTYETGTETVADTEAS